MLSIAFVGLGAMGLRMARRIADAGIEVAAFDVNPAQLGQIRGHARIATSVADAADGADALFSVVPADLHSRTVVDEFATVAKAGQTFVDFSTISPSTIEDHGTRLKTLGVETISAGMTKSIGGATDGTLSLYLGGPPSIPDHLRPAFDAIATDLMMVGSLGAAKALKLVNNMTVCTLDIAITEALTLARQFGIDHGVMADAIAAGGCHSWPLDEHIIKHVVPDVLGPGWFATRLVMKDMRLCIDFAGSLGLPAPFAGLALAEYRGLMAYGHAEDYHLVVVRWLENAANLGGRPTTPPRDTDAVVADIVAGVRAVQSLVSADAVRMLGLMGIAPVPAAEFLAGGSAGNDSLEEMTKALGGEPAQASLGDLIGALQRTIAAADAANVPGLVFETARARAYAVLGRLPARTSLWSTVSW